MAAETRQNNGNRQRALVLLATTTEEKVAQYQAIARAKGLPVEFRRINEIVDAFHSAPENTGDVDRNAEQKLGEVKNIIIECRKPDSRLRRILEKKCQEWDVSTDPRHIYFATDDSTFKVPKKIWTILREKLAPYVADDLLESINRGGDNAGPGAETGPILAAVGIARFFNLLREAAGNAGYEAQHIPIGQYTTLKLNRLSGPPQTTSITVNNHKQPVRHYLYAPSGLQKAFQVLDEKIVKTYHFLRNKSNPQKPLADDFDDYLVNHSIQARIVDELARVVQQSRPNGNKHHGTSPVVVDASSAQGEFVVGLPTQMSNGNIMNRLDQNKITVEIPENTCLSGDHLVKTPPTAYATLNFEDIMHRSDALIFTPFDPAPDPKIRTLNYLALFSAKVAKQLISRDMNKPIVVMDWKGCWKPAIDFGFDLVNRGMSKDFMRTPIYDGGVQKIINLKGVEHYANSYFDVVSGNDLETLERAAMQVLAFRRQCYSKFEAANAAPAKFIARGEEPPDGMFKVAVFVSASNENKRLLTDMSALGRGLAENQFGLIWGGGDRHAMGAVYEGYKVYKDEHPEKKTWMGAFSTEPILKSETEYGRFPAGIDYWEQNTDIYQRMAHMIHKNDIVHANAIIISPGGDGTTQEWLAVLALKHQLPKMMAGKSLIIYAPDLYKNGTEQAKDTGDGPPVAFWEKGVRTVMGDEFYERISKNHKACAADGIYFATNKEELLSLTQELRQKNSDEQTKHRWQAAVSNNNQSACLGN
ncbi:MAG: hypothetical protein KGI29_08315 [Pseudomonadota bacterium]|nr:hypothetical protein [Pseudomonadota bacterium]